MSDEAKTERVMKHYEGIITTHPLYPICKLGGYAVDSTTFNEDNPLYAFAFHAVRFDDIEK